MYPPLNADMIQRLAIAFCEADGNQPYNSVQKLSTNMWELGQMKYTPAWEAYIPKVFEFMNNKVIYDRLFGGTCLPFMQIDNSDLPPLFDHTQEERSQFFGEMCTKALEIEKPLLARDLRQLVKDYGIKSYTLRQCSICNTSLRYIFNKNEVSYDHPSCGCSYGNGPEPRTWDDFAQAFNIQTNGEARHRMICDLVALGS